MYFTGHFGSWELQVIVHAYRFGPIVMVARTLDNPLLERMIERLRGRAGTRVVPRRGAVRGLLGALKRRESVGMMIDQHMQDRSAVEVTFFRRPALTTSAIAALALRTGAPIIPVFALPIPRGRYRMVYEPPVEPPAPDDPDPVRTYTQRCTDVLETYVRRYPHLWLWMHRRWRRPAESGDGMGAEEVR
jgi:KDO2-lipid IV(A) lauroyltransferase